MTEPDKPSRILLMGIGGAGTRIIDRIQVTRFPDITTVALDTDKTALESVRADIHILLGRDLTRRWGEGVPAEAGAAVREVCAEMERLVDPADCVVVLAGLGRGAGSGAAPEIARIARQRGALVIAVAMLPFVIQQKTVAAAELGLHTLLMHADSVIVVDNQRYRDILSHVSVERVYETVDELICGLLQDLFETLLSPSYISIDYNDFHALFSKKGLAMVLHGECSEGNRNEGVVRTCLSSPSYDIDFRSAAGCVIIVTGGKDLGRYDADEIALSLTYELDLHADVVRCASVRTSLEGRVRVYAIMTGLSGTRNRLFGDSNG